MVDGNRGGVRQAWQAHGPIADPAGVPVQYQPGTSAHGHPDDVKAPVSARCVASATPGMNGIYHGMREGAKAARERAY